MNKRLDPYLNEVYILKEERQKLTEVQVSINAPMTIEQYDIRRWGEMGVYH